MVRKKRSEKEAELGKLAAPERRRKAAPAPRVAREAGEYRAAFCPCCGTSHGTKRLEYPQKGDYSSPATQNYWQWIIDRDRERGLDKDEPFGVIQAVGMGRGHSFGVIGYFGPEDDRDGFYPLVKARLLQAVKRWLQKGWLSKEEVEGILAMAEEGQ
ncbi:unnamed protein product [marine sediment metagenome]|uniref:Uncharacterized protein n=1 Tax=marine sediment metagenome TaxID=412755 RepID=X1IWL1_9ZZZZ